MRSDPVKTRPHLCRHYLSSQAVTSQVFSARVSLTAVFGMGTGGPSPQSAPTRRRGFAASFYFNWLPSQNLCCPPGVASTPGGVVHLQGLEPWTP